MSRAFKFGCRARLGGLVGLVSLLVVALAVLVVAAPASPSVSPNLAVDLASSSFSDTSVQATAFGPSGTGSIVLQHNPGNLVGFDITVDASGGVTFTGSSASVNPNLCGGSQFQFVLINTVSTTATTVRVAVACVGGATMGTGDLVLFRFGWSGAPGTVAVDSSSTLADSTPTSVPYTVANATVMDNQPPVITVAAGPSDAVAASGWYNRASSGTDGVEVDVSASDPSGVTHLSCTDGATTVLDVSAASGSFTLTDGTHGISCSATDGAGNEGAGDGSTPIPVEFKVDQTPPTLAPAVTPNPVFLHGTATVAANASDSGSGLDTGSVSCGSLDTGSIGIKQVTCTASDLAGNSGQGQASYTVVYRFLGFTSPVPKSRWQAGRTIPVKFQLGDVNGTRISDQEAQAIASSCRAQVLLTGPDPSPAIAAGPVCAGYDAISHRFLATLKTPSSLASGTYELVSRIYDTAQPPNVNTTGSESIKITH